MSGQNKFVSIFTMKQNSYFFWLLFSFVFFVSMAFLLPIRFEENDDVVMLLFASGRYTGTPEFRLVFINSIWGLILKGLYSITKKIEWYSLLFAICHILSLSIVFWSVFKRRINLFLRLLFLLFFLILEIRFIAQFQFTTTTTMLAFSGLILTLNNDKSKLNIGLILFAISTLIRFEAAILVFILFIPMLIKRFHDNRDWKVVKNFVFTFLAVIVFFTINYFSYRTNNDWDTYYSYNNLRGAINDNPNTSKIGEESFYDFNVDDYSLLQSFFQDYNIINPETIKKINTSISSVPIKTKFHNIYPALRKHTQVIGIVVLLTILLSFISSKYNTYYLFASLLLFLVVCSFVSFNGTLKLRVLLSCITVVIFSFLYFSNFEKSNIYSGFVAIVLLYFSFILINRTMIIIRKTERWHNTEFQEQKSLLCKYAEGSKDLVLPFAGSLSIEYYPVFQVSSAIPQKTLCFGGWVTGIPYNKNKIFTHRDLINNNVVLINQESYKYVSIKLIKTINHNYQVDSYTEVIEQSNKYLLFQIKTKCK
jgi:hypothetical protein